MFIQTQTTPNPDALKFLPGRAVMADGTLDMRNAAEAAASPLAEQLMALGGISGIFYGGDFIAVTKAAAEDWAVLKPQVQARIMDFYLSGAPLLRAAAPAPTPAVEQNNDPVIRAIMQVIETHIRPGVARDGGDVRFVAFDQGVLYLEMRGSCAGCPSAGRTLKSGIEKIMQEHVPEVMEVFAVN